MAEDLNPSEVAVALQAGIRLLVRRLRQVRAEDELTLPETSALSRLDRGGAMTPSALARLEEISPQSMGATLASLEARGLIARRADPGDRRRAIMSLTEDGVTVLRSTRHARAEHLAHALSEGFSRTEIKQLMAAAPLIERLAQSF